MRHKFIKILIVGVVILLLNTLTSYIFSSFMEGSWFISEWKDTNNNFAPMFVFGGFIGILGLCVASVIIFDN